MAPRVVRVACRGLALGWIALLALAAPSHAHEELERRIERVTRELAADPTSTELLLRRADLQRRHRGFAAARLDLFAVERLVTISSELERAWAELLLDEGEPRSALPHAERAVPLASEAERRRAEVLRARALDALDRRAEAADAWTAALDAIGPPAPELYVARAASTRARGAEFVGAALAGLDAGIARLGALPQLELPAIELELERGATNPALVRSATDAALARVDALAAGAKRKEAWLARRGEILFTAGRTDEARTALRAARAALATLPAKRRHTAAMEELARGIEDLLTRLPTSSLP